MSAPAAETAAATLLYVHVPFRVVKCGYCDFNSYPADGDEPCREPRTPGPDAG